MRAANNGRWALFVSGDKLRDASALDAFLMDCATMVSGALTLRSLQIAPLLAATLCERHKGDQVKRPVAPAQTSQLGRV